MSFNSRLGSSRVHRGRPSAKFNREPQGPSRPHEDAQPNELLRKRVFSGPPTVRSSAPQSHRSSWRGHHPSRGRGNAPSPRRWSMHGNSTPTQSWGTLHENSSGDSSGPVDIGPPNPAFASKVANTLPQGPVLPRLPPDPDGKSGFDTERRQGRLSPTEGSTTTIHPSTPSVAFSGVSGSSSSSWPPPKRRKVVRSDQRSDNHRPREPPSPAVIPSNDNAMSPLGQTSAVVPSNSASIASPSTSLASASDILLTDLSLPSGDNTVTPLIPIPKRLKVIPPGAAAPVHPPPSLTSGNAGISSSIQETHPALSELATSTSTSLASPPASMQVKRERSPSPSLAPRLVTEGCVRIAPLPPECRNKQPNFQAARQQLAAVEMKKLRVLGLDIVRIFTREDGMVIDWKSKVPVLSDTLRPPSRPSSPHRTLEPGTVDVDATAGLAGGVILPPGMQPAQPAVAEAARPQTIQAEQPATPGASQLEIVQVEQPVNRPKKRRKRKHSSSGTQDTVIPKPNAVELMGGSERIAGLRQVAAPSAMPPPTLPVSNKRQDLAPPQPPLKKSKHVARSSAPQPTSQRIDLPEGGLPSIPTPSYVTGPGPAVTPTVPRPHASALDGSGGSRATHQPMPAAGPASGSASTDARPAALKAAAATHPPVHALVPPVVCAPAPPPIHAPAPHSVLPSTSSPVRATALSSVYTPALPAYIPQEDLVDAALNFLRRYLTIFTTSRASLAPAYSRSALFSLHTHTPEGWERHPLQLGRDAVVAALLALPAGVTLCSWPPSELAHELQWDIGCVPGSASGDVLLACYAVQEYGRDDTATRGRKGENENGDTRGKGKGKGKGKERAGVPPRTTVRWSCEQRFILRRRDLDADGDGDEDDRNVAALWPLVAVSHQMRVRLLP